MIRACLTALASVLAFSSLAPAAQPVVARVELVVGARLPEEGEPAGSKSPLKSPFGVDFDAAGSMFIVELEGGRAFERTVDGTVTQIGGDGSKSYQGDGGPLARATFNGMHNVAVTKSGKMLIADTWNNCVREVDLKTRAIRTLAGTGKQGFRDGPAAEAEFHWVMCVTLSPDEKVAHIADINNRRVRKLDLATGQVTTIAGNGMKGVPQDGAKALEAPLVDPRAVASDSQGRVYVLERSGHALRRVDPDGTIRTVAGTGKAGHRDGPALEAQLNGPKHLCVDDRDRVFIADDVNAAIRCYDPATETVSTVLGRGNGDAKIVLLHPHGVTWEQGTLYALDTYHDRIFRLTFEPSKE
jgi:DNA-binding beta-propeller fold protein YncE